MTFLGFEYGGGGGGNQSYGGFDPMGGFGGNYGMDMGGGGGFMAGGELEAKSAEKKVSKLQMGH